MDFQFYTGADHRVFMQVLLLVQSFIQAVPGGKLTVVDFGLTPDQRYLLEQLGVYGATPALPLPDPHPWHYKAAAIASVPPTPEGVVWLDADMIVVDNIGERLKPVFAAMEAEGQLVGATANDHEFAVDKFLRDDILRQLGIAPCHPYLNAGFFMARSRAWVREYTVLTLRSKLEKLFEQNAFNIIAWCQPGLTRVLDQREWNVHGSTIDRVTAGADGGLSVDGRRIGILHATSFDTRHLEMKPVTWQAGSRLFSGQWRLFTDPLLRQVQIGIFDRFLQQYRTDAVEA